MLPDSEQEKIIAQRDRLALAVAAMTEKMAWALWPVQFLLEDETLKVNRYAEKRIRESVEMVKREADSLMVKLTD